MLRKKLLKAQLALAPVWRLREAAAVFFCAALVSRVWLSKHLDAVWVLPVSGLLGDLLVAVFLACSFALLLLLHRVVWYFALALWALLSVANIEHIYALDAPLRLENYRFLLSEDFIRGSAFSIVSWLAAVAVASAVLLLLLRRLPARLLASPLTAAAVLALAAGSGYAAWRQSLPSSGWRHASPLAVMLSQTWRRTAGGPAELFAEADTGAFYSYEANVGRRTGLVAGAAGKNVLLLVLEGLPGVYLEQVRQATGVRVPIFMPKFSRIARRALVVPHFVANSHGTIMGLYSLLCADYSMHGDEMPKPELMVSLATERLPRCLPRVLAEAGYRTVYMQASDLNVSWEKTIMPRAGFTEVLGKDHEAARLTGNFWGESDASLFGRVLAKIDLLRTGRALWFLTASTVGTHHPFIAPDEYLQRHGDMKTAAVSFLDDQLAKFMAALQERGITRDTLVLIVSDESHGVPGHPFGSYWGLAVALGPGIVPTIADGVFGQIDIAVSLLDYLGLADMGTGLIGRSIFRSYTQRRRILFGDYALLGNSVLNCFQQGCLRYALRDGKLFAPAYAVTGASASGGDSDVYYSALARAVLLRGSHTRKLLYSSEKLAWTDVERDQLSTELAFPANSKVEVLLDIENTGKTTTASTVLHMLDSMDLAKRVDDGMPRVQLPPLPPGSRVNLHYTFINIREKRVLLRLLAFGRKAKRFNLRIDKLRILSTPTDIGRADFSMNRFELHLPSGLERQDGIGIFSVLFESLDSNNDPYSSQSETSNRAYFIAPFYKIGSRIDFSDANDWLALLYLAGDWSYPSSWGVWSDGIHPSVGFRLGKLGGADEYEINVEILPHIQSPFVAEREIAMLLNGTEIAKNLVFFEQKPDKLSFTVPAELLVENGINTLEFFVKRPFVPYSHDMGDDITRYGIGLISFQLSPLGGGSVSLLSR